MIYDGGHFTPVKTGEYFIFFIQEGGIFHYFPIFQSNAIATGKHFLRRSIYKTLPQQIQAMLLARERSGNSL